LMCKNVISGRYGSWRLRNSIRLKSQSGLQLWRT
jgi:hypothetical protein